jgi:hypothetical protein
MAEPGIAGIGSIFVDDIVLADGTTHMGLLGGGVLHAMLGAVIWGERPGLVGLAGADLDVEAHVFLREFLDTRGLKKLAIRQARAWQLYEDDGQRTEVPRVSPIEPFIDGPQPPDWPAAYDSVKGFYALQGFEGIRHWRAARAGLLLWEPLQQVMVAGARQPFLEALHLGDIDVVSPNLLEAQVVLGASDPQDLVAIMWRAGARIVALRMGEHGALVGDATTGQILHVPAYPSLRVADPTGAGNTFCGGLLLGLARGLPLAEAAALAAVSASYCVETFGTLNPATINPGERDQRLRAIRAATSPATPGTLPRSR